MDRPKRGAQTVLEPLEEVSQRDIDMLVNAAWSPDSSEEQTFKAKRSDVIDDAEGFAFSGESNAT